MCLSHKHENLNLIPKKQTKGQAWEYPLVTSVLERKKRLPGACWPTNLTQLMQAKSVKDPVQKEDCISEDGSWCCPLASRHTQA